MSDPVFETDGILHERYLWMWYCPKCHSTMPPFVHDKAERCPYCEQGTLIKAKVEEPFYPDSPNPHVYQRNVTP